ncbi:SOUL heme-binding protein [Roseivivax jejudonensis]|uniref:SOUL heme-binding protein n=1 Tax=Roseivivax jejudonensis TaxID=1529041 RepID=A0A1X6YGT9_9RHOB|nr:heme-binding protein [Roseivivax jejudonensis]SLN20196.1 SOUL heme-binding protein [Roseivivax jejudonensis]
MAAASVAADGVAGGYRGYEAPDYTVEARAGDVEIRRYAPHLVAEVTLAGPRDGALRQGFRILAGYIFGKNASEEKIAMTVPVTRQPAVAAAVPDGDAWTVSFVVPRGRSQSDLPEPHREGIRLTERPAERLAVLAFSGLATEARIARQARRLDAGIAALGETPSGALRAMWYDDPFTLPWRRRNEIARPLP